MPYGSVVSLTMTNRSQNRHWSNRIFIEVSFSSSVKIAKNITLSAILFRRGQVWHGSLNRPTIPYPTSPRWRFKMAAFAYRKVHLRLAGAVCTRSRSTWYVDTRVNETPPCLEREVTWHSTLPTSLSIPVTQRMILGCRVLPNTNNMSGNRPLDLKTFGSTFCGILVHTGEFLAC